MSFYTEANDMAKAPKGLVGRGGNSGPGNKSACNCSISTV